MRVCLDKLGITPPALSVDIAYELSGMLKPNTETVNVSLDSEGKWAAYQELSGLSSEQRRHVGNMPFLDAGEGPE